MLLLLIAFFSLVKNTGSEILIFVWVRIWLLNHPVHFKRSVCRIVIPPIPRGGGVHFHINLHRMYKFSAYIPKDGIKSIKKSQRSYHYSCLWFPPLKYFRFMFPPLYAQKLLFSPPSLLDHSLFFQFQHNYSFK